MKQHPDIPAEQAIAPATLRAVVIGSIIVGTLIRLLLAAISQGSDDAVLWEHFAWSVRLHGLLESYRSESMLNHPPLPVIWAWLALDFGKGFAFVLKLPGILADAAAIALVARIWMSRREPFRARNASLVLAFCPLPILVSGYHGNTDSVYAFLSLLSAWFLADRRNFFLGGLALGAAINVKLVPLLLIPGAMSLCRSPRDFLRLLAGLAICVIPVLPLLAVFNAVWLNMITYASQPDRWGIPLLIERAPSLHSAYQHLGRWVILAAVATLVVISRRSGRWNAYELFTLIYAAFLILTPGFGVQYAIILFPLLVAVSPRRAGIYGILAGVFLFQVYLAYLDGYKLPLLSKFNSAGFPTRAAVVGVLAWLALIEAVVHLIRRGTDSTSRDTPPPTAG